MTSKESRREIDGAKRLFQLAQRWQTSAAATVSAVEILRSSDGARDVLKTAKLQLSLSEKEVEDAKSYLKDTEKRWEVISIDIDDGDEPTLSAPTPKSKSSDNPATRTVSPNSQDTAGANNIGVQNESGTNNATTVSPSNHNVNGTDTTSSGSGAPSSSPSDGSGSTESNVDRIPGHSWTCDFCPSKFSSYNAAVAHELGCNARPTVGDKVNEPNTATENATSGGNNATQNHAPPTNNQSSSNNDTASGSSEESSSTGAANSTLNSGDSANMSTASNNTINKKSVAPKVKTEVLDADDAIEEVVPYNIVVEGCGTADINGTYTLVRYYDSAPVYSKPTNKYTTKITHYTIRREVGKGGSLSTAAWSIHAHTRQNGIAPSQEICHYTARVNKASKLPPNYRWKRVSGRLPMPRICNVLKGPSDKDFQHPDVGIVSEVVVDSCGNEEINGIYKQNGYSNQRPCYFKTCGSSGLPLAKCCRELVHSHCFRWCIYLRHDDQWLLYYQTEDKGGLPIRDEHWMMHRGWSHNKPRVRLNPGQNKRARLS